MKRKRKRNNSITFGVFNTFLFVISRKHMQGSNKGTEKKKSFLCELYASDIYKIFYPTIEHTGFGA